MTKYVSLPGLGLVAKRSGSATYWLHTDRLGSVQSITDASGSVVQRRRYRPYGESIGDTTAHVEARGYIGERQDADTGLSYLHARYYDSTLGLFVSPDPLSPTEAGVGFNRYAYGGGDPIGTSDPSGYAANQLCGTQFGDREDCQSGSGYFFQLGGGISWSDGGSGNAALDENAALADRFFATQPVVQPLTDGTTIVVQRDRDGVVTTLILDSAGQILSSIPDYTYSERSGGCNGGAAVRCGETVTLAAMRDGPLITSDGWMYDSDGRLVMQGGRPTSLNDPDILRLGIIIPIAGGRLLTGYTRHGINQAISRGGGGVSSRAILDALRNPLQLHQQAGGALRYVGEAATVIINEVGKIITTWGLGIVNKIALHL